MATNSTPGCDYIHVSPNGTGSLGSENNPTDLITAIVSISAIYSSRNVILLQQGNYSLGNISLSSLITLDGKTFSSSQSLLGGWTIVAGKWVKQVGSSYVRTTLVLSPQLGIGNTISGAQVGFLTGNFSLCWFILEAWSVPFRLGSLSKISI